MLKPEIAEILNQQINEELFSSYLYLAMAMRCKSIGFEGAAQWFMVQAKEELTHSEKIWNYLNMHGADVVLKSISTPEVTQSTLLELFEATLTHEKHITGCVHSIIQKTREHADFATESFMQWFLNEQVEEEANDSEIISSLKLIGSDGSALYLYDKELGQRTLTPPAAV